MENIIDDEKRILEENLISQESIGVINNKEKLFEVDFVISKKKLLKFFIEFDENLKNITLKFNNNLSEVIKFYDVIGSSVDDKSNILSTSSQLKNTKVLKLNFFPNLKTTECNFCGLFCCKCCQNVYMRKVKVINIVIRLMNFLLKKAVYCNYPILLILLHLIIKLYLTKFLIKGLILY
jgi:hypothetical protein